jgi:hypothetical protein
VATLVLTLLYGGWIGLAAAAVVAVPVLAWVHFREIAVVVSGLLLLAMLLFSACLYGGWVNAAVIAVMAVAAVLVLACALPPQAAARPGQCAAQGGIACGRRAARPIWPEFVSSPSLARSSLTRRVPPARPGICARSRSASQRVRFSR